MFRRHFHNTKRKREGFEFGFGRGQERFGGPQGRERFFKKGNLQFVILKMLKDESKHGYQIIKDLEAQFKGFYSPSPGSVYPILQMLEDRDFVSIAQDGKKKIYTITEEGIVVPAFDPSKGGGALMDINVYNIHLAVGLFGKPEGVAYFANIQKGIDTSGILQLDYNDVKVVCIGAKDSNSDNQSYIQGDNASINIKGPTNELKAFELKYNQGGTQSYQVNPHNHRMYEEFVKIAQIIKQKNNDLAAQKLEHSIQVIEVLEQALDSANIKVGPSQK